MLDLNSTVTVMEQINTESIIDPRELNSVEMKLLKFGKG